MKGYVFKPGYQYSPLMAIPRNAKCVCQSGKKWKKCCMEKLKVCHDRDLKDHHRMYAEWKERL